MSLVLEGIMDGNFIKHRPVGRASLRTSVYRYRPGMIPIFSKEPVIFNVQTWVFVCSARNHQLYMTYVLQSNYGKVPYSRA